ncbi:MAG: hypothetical protein M4D80_24035 [Myxococcota bacterium]|nr:hypothetical protein [Myxococcota bacterium]
MAGKKTKKKSSAKPAKKKAAKAPAKKSPAKKAPAKKAAPKKAAAKKAAPKKAAAKKAAPKKSAAPTPKAPKAPKARKAPKQPKESIEVIEVMDAGDDVVETAASTEPKASLRNEILAMARQLYGDKTDEELLALDPNDIDAMDPSMFYELLGEKYGVEADPDNDDFGGFGGPIKNLIAFVDARWDGKTRKDTPMPPGEWLEEYVHPAS